MLLRWERVASATEEVYEWVRKDLRRT
jgi:hypothetical protein